MGASGSAHIEIGIINTPQTAPDISNSENSIRIPLNADIDDFRFSSGDGNGQIEAAWSDRSTDATTTVALDGLTDHFGDSVNLATLKLFYCKNRSASNTVTIAGQTTADVLPWTDPASGRIHLKPGGAVCIIAPNAGYTITAGNADLTITNVDTTEGIDLVVAGVLV